MIISNEIYVRILNEASPALREQLAKVQAFQENLAIVAKLALTPFANTIRSAMTAAAKRDAFTVIDGGKHE
jgi:hypothetical protein